MEDIICPPIKRKRGFHETTDHTYKPLSHVTHHSKFVEFYPPATRWETSSETSHRSGYHVHSGCHQRITWLQMQLPPQWRSTGVIFLKDPQSPADWTAGRSTDPCPPSCTPLTWNIFCFSGTLFTCLRALLLIARREICRIAWVENEAGKQIISDQYLPQTHPRPVAANHNVFRFLCSKIQRW